MFSDDDLKRFEKSLAGEAAPKVLRRDQYKALVNRLKYAERIICSYSKFDFIEDQQLLVKKWLQSKGVEGA